MSTATVTVETGEFAGFIACGATLEDALLTFWRTFPGEDVPVWWSYSESPGITHHLFGLITMPGEGPEVPATMTCPYCHDPITGSEAERKETFRRDHLHTACIDARKYLHEVRAERS